MQLFENIELWADLGDWLQNIHNLLEETPVKILPKRKLLAKRLAQCLNSNLPVGIHKSTLQIYTMIFDNMKGEKDLIS